MLTNDQIEVYQSKADMLLAEYASQFTEKESPAAYLTKMPQNQWRAGLAYVGRGIFAPDDLKLKGAPHGELDVGAVEQAVAMYLELCSKYDKVPEVSGFQWYCGMSDATVYDWACGGYDSKELSPSRVDARKRGIYDRLRAAQEEALAGKLATGKQNPIGCIAILNHRYHWNTDTHTGEEKTPVALPASQLPRLGNPEAASLPSLAPDPGPVSSPGNDNDTAGSASPWLPKL